MTKNEQIKLILEDADRYCQQGDYSINIDLVDTEDCYFVGTGVGDGESYRITFDEVDLATDRFYKLCYIAIDVNDYREG